MELAGARVTVMGLGRFGGGVGVTRHLVSRGADVLVTDLEPAEKLGESIARIDDLVHSGRVTLRLGEHNVSDFTTCDLVVANPAVARPWENRFLRAAEAAGIPITTEIQLAVEALPERVVVAAITGSAGKSTTSALVHHILGAIAGSTEGWRAHLGGNIGGSLLDRLESIRAGDVVVLELSSFQLHWLRGFGPDVAAVTNLDANHLDWHVTLEHYRASKLRILEGQRAGSVAVLGPGVRDWPTARGVRRVELEPGASIDGLLIPGAHNELNAAMALEVCRGVCGVKGIGFEEGLATRAARTFAGLPHRLRHVATIAGVRFYDDSKSTTPQATMLALDAFPDERERVFGGGVHLIAGGYDKGQDLAPIVLAAPELKGMYTIGVTGEWLAKAAGTHALACGTLEVAMERVRERVGAGDVVLLSPGCASWDQFENYEKRGERFAALVRELFGVGEPVIGEVRG